MNRKKAIFILMGIILLGLYGYQKRAVFFRIATVFLFAAAFTIMLAPLCVRLESKGASPHLAAAISVVCFLLIAVLVISAFVPYLVTHCIDLLRRITPTLTGIIRYATTLLANYGIYLQQQSGLTDMIASVMSRITALLAKGGMAFAAQTGQIVFSIVIAYYFLCERQLLTNHLILLIPLAHRTAFLSAMLGCKNAVLGYLSGLIKTSLFVAGATFLGLALLGVRDAFLLALFMGVFEVLPYIGPVLAAIPILLTTLPQGIYTALISLALVILVQQIEGNFISPYFTASSTSIHPLAALISVFILGSLFGLWGILLAVPLVVVARSMLWSVRQTQIALSL